MKSTRIDKPLLLPIVAIKQENPYVKTFWFEHPLRSQPGQFVMLWVPGLDQKPFSIGYDTGDQFGLTIFAVGPLSKKLFELSVGARVGITGPYGKGFRVQDNTHYITIAGGYGAGPLGVLAERLTTHENVRIDFCIGARSQDLLLFEERVAALPNVAVHVSTDDGSKGQKGYVTQVVEQLLNQTHDQPVLLSACGPELMEKAVLDLANRHDVDCDISIERYMKCGYAICGQCCVDGLGVPMCTQGPVVDRTTANNITEFGKYHRDKTGSKHDY